MLANKKLAMSYIYEDEGVTFEVSDSEPGGAVKDGITMVSFAEYEEHHGIPHPQVADLRGMSLDLAQAIYDERFLTPIHFNDLPSGLDYRVLDVCINLGVMGGIRLLQPMLDVKVTGVMDDVTMSVMKCFLADPASSRPLIARISDGWLDLKRKAPHWPKYQKGWTARAYRARDRAIAMTVAAPAAAITKPSLVENPNV